MRRAHRQSGLSLLEFTLVVMIFSVLVAAGLDRIASLRVDIERAAVKHAVNNMQAALAVRFSELVVRGKRDQIRDWEGGNALALLREEYTRDGSSGPVSGPGEWSYRDGEVRYRPAYPQALTGNPDAIGRWRVEIVGSSDQPGGLVLTAVQPLLMRNEDPTGGS